MSGRSYFVDSRQMLGQRAALYLAMSRDFLAHPYPHKVVGFFLFWLRYPFWGCIFSNDRTKRNWATFRSAVDPTVVRCVFHSTLGDG